MIFKFPLVSNIIIFWLCIPILVLFFFRYALRNNRNNDEVCEDLVLMLTDTLNVELGGLGPETVLTSVEIENVQFQLTKQVNALKLNRVELLWLRLYRWTDFLFIRQARQVLKTNRSMKLERKVKRAIEKTLSAPQVQKLDEVSCQFNTLLNIGSLMLEDSMICLMSPLWLLQKSWIHW